MFICRWENTHIHNICIIKRTHLHLCFNMYHKTHTSIYNICPHLPSIRWLWENTGIIWCIHVCIMYIYISCIYVYMIHIYDVYIYYMYDVYIYYVMHIYDVYIYYIMHIHIAADPRPKSPAFFFFEEHTNLINQSINIYSQP